MIRIVLVATVSLLIILGGLAAVGVGGAWLTLPLLNIQRQATQQSLPYIQSKQSRLMDLAAQYERLSVEKRKYEDRSVVSQMEGQQRAIVAQMKQEASLIPNDQVPESARPYIRGENR